MGRLTLNVLLSFAQFEREVTGERIRDKIAASNKKGMWMGGMVPLGYDARNRALIVNPAEAETVRSIFRAYWDLTSVMRLKEHLDAIGVVSKCRVSASGRPSGGKPPARGALYLMLQNRIYRGEIVHKDKAYPGGHPAIVDEDLWNAVQTILAGNRVERIHGAGATEPRLLASILFDAEGERMTPSHTLKKGKRYRYYVSSRLVAGASDGRGQRLPATDIEGIVIRRLGDWFIDAPAVLDALAGDVPAFGAAAQRTMVDTMGRVAKRWPEMPQDELRQFLLAIDARIHAHVDRVDISLSTAALRQCLTDPHTGERDCNANRLDSATANPGDEPQPDGSRIHLTVAARLQRVGIEMKLIVGDGSQPPDIDSGLVRTLIRASRIREHLARDPGLSLADIAEHEGIVPSYATRIYRLNFLAPDIVEAMLDGRQSPALTLRKLLDDTRLPLDWTEQRQRLGFA